MCMPDDSRNIDSRTAPGARERLLVCLDHGRAGAGLVRYAARQADFDPDIWLVEIEDREGRHFITEKVAGGSS